MVGFSYGLFIWLLALPMALAATIGLLAGMTVSAAYKRAWAASAFDAILGAFTFVGVFLVALFLPWPGCFIADGWTLCNQFPYLWSLSFGSSALVPAVVALQRMRGESRSDF